MKSNESERVALRHGATAAVKDGERHLASLRDGRQVYLEGREIQDVTTHPAFRNAVRSAAALYDFQALPSNQELMTFESPTGGVRVNRAWQLPGSYDELVQRRRALVQWAKVHCGFMGRSPDHVASALAGQVMGLDVFERYNPEYAGNLRDYYQYVRDNDLYLTYVIINPQGNRSKEPSHQREDLLLRVVDEDAQGITVRGAKMLGTGSIMANEVFVAHLQPLRPGEEKYAVCFAVPMNTPGLRIVRNIPIMSHRSPEGHCELLFQNVRIPVTNLLGVEGEGFRLAQQRLGPGRVHHCMRSIGQCEVALDLMCERALEREAFGKHLAEFANIQDWIAESRLEIDQARLLVLKAAHRMDREGNAAARVDVSAIKVVAARLQTRILDRAMQVFGAMGLTPDTPLSYLWTWGRALRFLDGPDEVHLRVVARSELSRAKANAGRNAAYFVPPQLP